MSCRGSLPPRDASSARLRSGRTSSAARRVAVPAQPGRYRRSILGLNSVLPPGAQVVDNGNHVLRVIRLANRGTTPLEAPAPPANRPEPAPRRASGPRIAASSVALSVRCVSPARLQVHLRSDRPDEISFQVSPEQGPHRRCVAASAPSGRAASTAPALRDAACPISTGLGTRRVRLVRGEGRGVSD